MNLIVDQILTLTGGAKVSLAGAFAALARGEARGFPALRPHQRPAWHMFLVQLGALAAWTAGRADLPVAEAEWAAMLRGLTPGHEDDSPWQLIVDEWRKPAFMQAPMPRGRKMAFAETPDALDMLIAARNHDLKRAVMARAAPEDWVFALVSLQTCEGYGGSGKHGVARMNGGSSSRPMLGLAPARIGDTSLDPSAWWTRDVRRLLETRRAGAENALGAPGGPALLWLRDWPDGEQLDLRALDPWFIEICRRVRLAETGEAISAHCGTSAAARIDAKAYKGSVGDPWGPVHTDGKGLTLSGGDFDYKRLCELLFSGDWAAPLLARAGDGDDADMLLVAEAFSRGNSKTEGFKSRIVPLPGKIARRFAAETAAGLSKAQMREIEGFSTALRAALALAAAGGERGKVAKGHYARAMPARRRFDRAADRLFFPALWRRVEAADKGDDAAFDAKIAFLQDLECAARKELEAALPSIPCPAVLRPRAEARARRAFVGKLRGSEACSDLFNRERNNAIE